MALTQLIDAASKNTEHGSIPRSAIDSTDMAKKTANPAELQMMPLVMNQWYAMLIAVLACATAQAADSFAVPESVASVLNRYCIECHGAETSEADVRFDTLAKLDINARLELLNRAHEQLYFNEMPPKGEEQPTTAERTQLVDWVAKELRKHNASKLEDKLRKPEFGNYVDHDKIFSGEYKHLKGFTYDRRWLISEFIFNDKINRLIDHKGIRTIDGKRMTVIGDNGVNLGTQFGGASLRQSITNPFLLPTNIGVRYYDNTILSGGHLLTMISNAKKIAGYMSSEQTMKAHYPAMYRIMKLELEHRETLQSRERFLKNHLERVVQDIYKDQNEALLPKFVRMQLEEPPDYTDRKGNLLKKTNIGLLARYDAEDMQAIYLGITKYKQKGVTFEQVLEKCERDWFVFGIHDKRLRNRMTIMKVLPDSGIWRLCTKTCARRTYARPPTSHDPIRKWTSSQCPS